MWVSGSYSGGWEWKVVWCGELVLVVGWAGVGGGANWSG